MAEGPTPPGSERGPVARLLAREVQFLRETVAGIGATAARLWADRPPRDRSLAMFFLAGVAAVGISSVLAQGGLSDRLPDRRDWEAVRTLLERDARSGDAVLVSPAWAERSRQVLPPTAPILDVPDLEGEDLLGVRRVWILSLPEAPGFSRKREAGLLVRASTSGSPTRVGALELSRLDLAYANVPLVFLPDQLARATVSLGDAPCPAEEGVFRCPSTPRIRIAREVREAGRAPRPCIAVTLGEPLPAPLVVSFPPALVGRVLRGHLGALGTPSLPEPVRFSVQISGEEAGSVELSGEGYLPFRIDTARFAGFARPLSLVLTTPGAPVALCLDAAALP